MAFRGDIQGGQSAQAMGGFAPGGGLLGGQATSGIEKTLRWKVFFFAGACFTVAAGIVPFIYYLRFPQWAPATFLDILFLLMFGSLMIVLDFPIPHPAASLVVIRDNAYKFLLFMTRFTGRGAWYLFLATFVFSVEVHDLGAKVFGYICSIYLVLLGIAALIKGYLLSSRLEEVRKEIMKMGHGAEHYIARNQTGLSKAQFQAMVEAVLINQANKFTSDDLDYIINALSFTPYNDGQVSMEECEYWLQKGPMLCV
jgi:hypothetical protein